MPDSPATDRDAPAWQMPQPQTVASLRAALVDLDDDIPVMVSFDSGFGQRRCDGAELNGGKFWVCCG